MVRTFDRVRSSLVALAVAASLIGPFPSEAPASPDRPPTRLRTLDRSRKLTAAERKVMDRELPRKTLAEVVRRLGQPDQQFFLGNGHLRRRPVLSGL